VKKKKKTASRKAPKPRTLRRLTARDVELAREYQQVTSLDAVAAADREYIHSDFHGDGPGSHLDYHVDEDSRHTKHGDENRHYDSNAPAPTPPPGPGPQPPKPHGDINAGHLDWWMHTDYNKGDHIDIRYHGDEPPSHADYHGDFEQGHQDEGVHPDIA
jgi:hypothetical protein